MKISVKKLLVSMLKDLAIVSIVMMFFIFMGFITQLAIDFTITEYILSIR